MNANLAVPIESDGFLLDPETGEILGVCEEFRPGEPTLQEFERAMRRLGRLDAEIQVANLQACEARRLIADKTAAALEALYLDPEYVQATAVSNRSIQIIERAEKKSGFLKGLYCSMLETFAKANLSGKDRTYSHPLGSVSFRKVPPKIAVEHEDIAIAWLEKESPDAIKKSVLVSKLPKDVLPEPEVNGLLLVPGYDKVTIETSVGGQA